MPLHLYGLGVELGGRVRAPIGAVVAPYLALRFMRGHTPAGLQALLAAELRQNPWFALRGGVGYRFVGAIDAAVLVVGGRL